MNGANHNGGRIARNTLILYVRMLLLLFVGLYTSRVVLAALGADDYITKPFSIRELMARVKANLRKRVPVVEEKPVEVIQKKEEAKQEYQAKKFVSKEERKIRNRISFLEKGIESIEAKMAEIEASLANPGEGDDIMDLTRAYLENKRELDFKMEEWEKLNESLEE